MFKKGQLVRSKKSGCLYSIFSTNNRGSAAICKLRNVYLVSLTDDEGLRMTQNEVAERIGVTRRTLNNWLKSGKFPDCCIRIMGRRQPGTFDPEKVEAWIKENVK